MIIRVCAHCKKSESLGKGANVWQGGDRDLCPGCIQLRNDRLEALQDIYRKAVVDLLDEFKDKEDTDGNESEERNE